MGEYVTPIWKKTPKKQHKVKNNPKPTDQDLCRVCSRPYAELHEIFFGIHRQKSIQYKMQVRLCEIHHRNGSHAVHNNTEFNLRLKQEFQSKFESIYGHKKFMQEFGKNYIGITLEEFLYMGVA